MMDRDDGIPQDPNAANDVAAAGSMITSNVSVLGHQELERDLLQREIQLMKREQEFFITLTNEGFKNGRDVPFNQINIKPIEDLLSTFDDMCNNFWKCNRQVSLLRKTYQLDDRAKKVHTSSESKEKIKIDQHLLYGINSLISALALIGGNNHRIEAEEIPAIRSILPPGQDQRLLQARARIWNASTPVTQTSPQIYAAMLLYLITGETQYIMKMPQIWTVNTDAPETVMFLNRLGRAFAEGIDGDTVLKEFIEFEHLTKYSTTTKVEVTEKEKVHNSLSFIYKDCSPKYVSAMIKKDTLISLITANPYKITILKEINNVITDEEKWEIFDKKVTIPELIRKLFNKDNEFCLKSNIATKPMMEMVYTDLVHQSSNKCKLSQSDLMELKEMVSIMRSMVQGLKIKLISLELILIS